MTKSLYFIPMAGLDNAYEDERLKLIGQIVRDWNLCESVMQVLSWQLCGLDRELGECITTDLGNVSLLTLCRNTLNRLHSGESYFHLLTEIFTLFDECRQARNASAHFVISADQTTFVAFSLTMKSGRGSLTVRRAPISNEELELYASAIAYLLECLAEAMHILNDEPIPWRDKRLLPVYIELLKQLRAERRGQDLPFEAS